MTTERRFSQPVRMEIVASKAFHTYELLMWDDPSISLADVREQFRQVARWEKSHGRECIWATFPLDAAVCIVAGIDPESGEPIGDKEKTLRRYEERNDWRLTD